MGRKMSNYWISNNRCYELTHFCLQYDDWVRERAWVEDNLKVHQSFDHVMDFETPSDHTAKYAIKLAELDRLIKMVEFAAEKTSKEMKDAILKSVTSGLSYDILCTKIDIPCGREMFYQLRKKFFWILSNIRENFHNTDDEKSMYFYSI